MRQLTHTARWIYPSGCKSRSGHWAGIGKKTAGQKWECKRKRQIKVRAKLAKGSDTRRMQWAMAALRQAPSQAMVSAACNKAPKWAQIDSSQHQTNTFIAGDGVQCLIGPKRCKSMSKADIRRCEWRSGCTQQTRMQLNWANHREEAR